MSELVFLLLRFKHIEQRWASEDDMLCIKGEREVEDEQRLSVSVRTHVAHFVR